MMAGWVRWRWSCLMTASMDMFGLVVSSDAGSNQKEFDKKRRCDATQYVTVDVDQMIVKKKFLAVFAENKCARPIQIVACY